MPQINNAQARLIDPVLTTVAQGYQNADMVGEELFPVVYVGARGGKIIQFSREGFQVYNTGRSPGGATKRVSFGYAGAPFVLEQHALEGVLPRETEEEASAVLSMDFGVDTVKTTQDIILLRHELAMSTLARTAANYPTANKVTLSGTSQWDDYSGTSDPLKNIEQGRQAIRAATGRMPNKVLLSPGAFSACAEHPKIIDRIKYTGRDSVTEEILAKLFKVDKVVVGNAIYDTGEAATLDVWGKDVVLAFTQVGTVRNRGLPSYGYTYRLRNYPMVEMPYQERNAKSMIYPVTDELSPVIAASGAGYLIKNAVS